MSMTPDALFLRKLEQLNFPNFKVTVTQDGVTVKVDKEILNENMKQAYEMTAMIRAREALADTIYARQVRKRKS